MRNLLKKYWLAIILVAVFVLIVSFFFFRREKPTPSPTPTPTAFEITNTYPRPGTYEVVIADLAIEFLFTKDVDLAKTAIKISPSSDIDISYGDTQRSVVVKPEGEWEMDVLYTFEVTAVSKEGESLEKPFEYTVRFTPLTESGLREN